jgi:hypothetical protein
METLEIDQHYEINCDLNENFSLAECCSEGKLAVHLIPGVTNGMSEGPDIVPLSFRPFSMDPRETKPLATVLLEGPEFRILDL